ncbi:MAG: hypothetical protein HXS48_15400 [Theionarchaea archaeon]|nr:MAG: hypothetical protein AYK19_11805 [Theionarchaea archaeon DG-70-1]MBU7028317.1 hypothetical protein [Theionarchaea archaeon]
MEEKKDDKKNVLKEKNSIKNIVFSAMLLSGATILIISVISFIAGIFLKDPLLIRAEKNLPHWTLIKMIIFFLLSMFLFLYIPLKSGILKQTISKKSGILLVIFLTYLFSSISLAFFLEFSTEMVDYEEFLINVYGEEQRQQIQELSKSRKFSIDFKESFFDAVSGFTTTGLTAFRKTDFYVNGKEIPKIDVQPRLIHIIRASYLWIGGLGIMFFYLYFSPVPSLMVNVGYEISAERSLPKFIRLEGLSFSLVYVIITCVGIFLLYSSISSVCSSEGIDDKESIITHSVVLSFSSISTGGFSPGSQPVNELEIVKYEIVYSQPLRERYLTPDDLGEIRGREIQVPERYREVRKCRTINKNGLIVIMGLMLIGAMPLFSLHRPWKFFKRWIIFAVFLLPIFSYAVPSYSKDPQLSLNRAFDAISAFTTTGLYTSQFEADFNKFLDVDYANRRDIKTVEKIYYYRFRSIYIIALMFIGGASYSTAGGWGFFNVLCIIYAFYLILTGKFEKALTKYIRGLVLSFLIFFSIFAIGTFFCYESGLFGMFSPDSEPAAIADYVINAAFYEISALSTVGLMPSSMIQNSDIYYHNLAYGALLISMLIGRIYYMIIPFILSFIDSRRGV